MTASTETVAQGSILAEVITGMNKCPKQISSKFFYDENGSALFDEICKLDEYYPTRTEMRIMRDNISEITSVIGEKTLLLELGSGSSVKIRMLLENLRNPCGYIPMDISSEHLIKSIELLQQDYPKIPIYPLVADYTKEFSLPEISNSFEKIAAYFPGSTIGNFTPENAKKFLSRIRNITGETGALLIGVDLKKDFELLNAAYNDNKGITAKFNLNILTHLNTEINSNFDLSKFRHKAFYNSVEGRIEMRLISLEEQLISMGENKIRFEKDEEIITEYSYKYSVTEFQNLISDFYQLKNVWTDENNYFSVQYYEVK